MSPHPLTERHWEILEALDTCHNRARPPQPEVAPIDLGGGNGSHHSDTLRTLRRWGLVESRRRGMPWAKPGQSEPRYTTGARGSRVYRLSLEGQRLVNVMRAQP